MSDSNLSFRDEIVPDHVGCHLFIFCDDNISPSAGSFMTETMIMPLQPIISMMTVAQETEIIYLDNPAPRCLISVFFHDYISDTAKIAHIFKKWIIFASDFRRYPRQIVWSALVVE